MTYRPDCAAEVAERQRNLDPSAKAEEVDTTSFIPESTANSDGTYLFATRAIRFKNDAVGPLQPRPKPGDIWSLDNPDLVDDVYNWAQETPQLYYVLAGALVLLILLTCCICACCRCCCGCCCGVRTKAKSRVQSEKLDDFENKKALNHMYPDSSAEPRKKQVAQQQFGSKDVLNE